MKPLATHRLFAAIGIALATSVQAGPRTQDRPHIAPVMRLQPSASVDGSYDLLIYGDIGDSWWGDSVTAKSVVEQLNALDATVATINVRINSYGGSVADGLAIYNALKRHKATKAVTVDGVAMSSASLIAMAGDTREIPPTSLLMIHAPWGGLYGNAKEMRQYADILDKFSESMADAYVAASGMSREDVLALLTDGEDHYYTGDEAVAAGFATSSNTAADQDDDDNDEDESARASAFAQSLLERITARGATARYAGLAVAAAMRRAPHATPAPAAPAADAPNPPAASAAAPQPAPAGTSTVKETATMPNLTEDQKKALAARRQAIRGAFAPFLARTDLDQAAVIKLQDECLDDDDMTVDAAGAKLLALLGKDTASVAGGHRVEGLSQDETKTYREGMALAIEHRKNPGAKLDERAREFRGMTLIDMARDCLARAGIQTRGMSRQEIGVKALQSTSDFPAILENVITKSLRRGYDGTSRTFVPFCRQATLPDFKEVSRVQLSGAPNLKRVLEGAEYEFGNFSDGGEKYAVQKYGRIVHISWETLVNDDLNAFTAIPQAFGASAGDLESDIVYGILTGNPSMSDGVALFHASHGNLGTPAALINSINPNPAVPSPLAEMRQGMLLQKGLEGRYITVRPRFLIVPPGLEEAALRVTNAAIVAARGNDANVIGPSLTPIVEPRLHDSDADAWYGAAEPTTVDTIEYAYLEGNEGVFTETMSGFDVDGLKVKCRHVFGAKAIDYRGLYKNAGGTPTAFPGP